MSGNLIIAVVRHGKSQTNQDHELALEIPNWLINLVHAGRKQAFDAGLAIRDAFPEMKWLIFSSQYERALETASWVKKMIGENALGIVTTDFLREFFSGSEAANDKTYNNHISDVYGDNEYSQDDKNNPFYFQEFPKVSIEGSPADGESGLDVLSRTKVMTEALIEFAKTRDFSALDPVRANSHSPITDIDSGNIGLVLTTHSVAISALLDNLGIQKFETMASRFRAGNGNPFFIEISPEGKVRLMDEVNQGITEAGHTLP